MEWDSTNGSVVWGLSTNQASYHGHWILTERDNRNKNHDHSQTVDPVLFVHSAEDPDTDNTKWVALLHNQTQGELVSGKGGLDINASIGGGGDGTLRVSGLSSVAAVASSGGTGASSKGILSYHVVEEATGTAGSPNVLTADETGRVLTDEGQTDLVYHSLPAAAAGISYTAIVQAGKGHRLTAQAGDTIRIAASVSSSGGYTEATTTGNTITLVAVNATEWYATSTQGTWTLN
jgi:hypothetical protein